jgi:8-oxo-dGTP pyrophosphatase MutT (NUDIX family)
MPVLSTDPIFAKVYNPKILHRLEKRYGPFRLYHTEIAVPGDGVLRDMMGKINQKGRRAEVVMVLPNEQGEIWLHTKDFYPDGVYRLMTGGLEAGEKPDITLRREVFEETGFTVTIDRCLAVITYTFILTDHPVPFASYIFLTQPTSDLPHPTDSGERITHFKACPVAELPLVAQQLQALTGKFADWGLFRAVAHQLTYEQVFITVAKKI